MKHDLNDLLRQRFQGHEAPVPPGTWQAIQAGLTTAPVVADQDTLTELFRERFQGHETAVPDAVWQGIGTQLGHTAAAGGMGVMGWVAAGVAAVVIGAGGYFLLGQEEGAAPATDKAVAEVVVVPQEAAPVVQEPTPVPVVQQVNEAQEEVSRADAPAPANTPTEHGANPVTAEESPIMERHVPVMVEPIGTMPEVATPVRPEVVTDHNPQLVESIISEMTAQAKAAADAEDEAPAAVAGPEGEDQAVSLPEPIARPADLPRMFLPNTFTPNGDGHNDQYTIGGGEHFDQILMRVYSVKDNRLVFSTNMNEPWTGSGCDEGYYLVAVEAIAPDKRLVTEGKVVFLNRSHVN